jgi:predicted nucleic acid-binding protein
VISEVQRPQPDPKVTARLAAIPADDFFLSVITIGEIVSGISRIVPSRRRTGLEVWLARIVQLHALRILAVDLETARIWGEVTARAAASGRLAPAADALIAATAIRHGLHVVTRNTPDFQATGALLIDPWQS